MQYFFRHFVCTLSLLLVCSFADAPTYLYLTETIDTGDTLNWKESQEYCQDTYNTYLAITPNNNSLEEAKNVIKSTVFIGLRKNSSADDDQYYWDDGYNTSVTAYWPNGDDTDEYPWDDEADLNTDDDCGVMSTILKYWDTYNCSARNVGGFLCQAPTVVTLNESEYWYDDLIYNNLETYYDITEIGWLVHNVKDSPSNNTQLFEGQTVSGSSDDTLSVTTSNITNYKGIIFHGPFSKEMVTAGDEYVTLSRGFQCVEDGSEVVTGYYVWYCGDVSHSFTYSQNDADILSYDINITDGASTISNAGNAPSCEATDSNIYEKHVRLTTNGTTVLENVTFDIEMLFEMSSDNDWVMIYDTELTCTNLTCTDYDSSYEYTNGEDYTWNMTDLIQLVSTGNDWKSDDDCGGGDPAFLDETLSCGSSTGCNLDCSCQLSCLLTHYTCNSTTGCNILCTEEDSCIEMVINATEAGSSLAVRCDEQGSCRKTELYVDGDITANVYCLVDGSCQDLAVDVDNAEKSNVTVFCFVEGACDGLRIKSDGNDTQVRLYEMSTDIVIENAYGYDSDLQNVWCASEYFNFIARTRDVTSGTTDGRVKVGELVEDEYTDGLPCADVTFECEDGTSCSMNYWYRDIGYVSDLWGNDDCLYMLVSDIAELRCSGQCKRPTVAPTTTPSTDPTAAPSLSPSAAPTLPPTPEPTGPETPKPTENPSKDPTAAPTYSPTPGPSPAPSLAPSFMPSEAPTPAPSFSPSMSPTRVPTDANHAYRLQKSYWSTPVYAIGMGVFSESTYYNSTNSTETTYYKLFLNDTSIPWAYSDYGSVVDWIFDNNATDANWAVWLIRERVMRTLIMDGAASALEDHYYNFDVTMEKVNGLAIENENKDEYPGTVSKYKAKVDDYGCSGEMHLKFKVYYEAAYQAAIPAALRGDEFRGNLETQFRDLFNISNLTVCTYDKDEITAEYATTPDNSVSTIILVTALLGASFVVGVAAYIWNVRDVGLNSSKGFAPVDNADYLAPMILGIQCYDVVFHSFFKVLCDDVIPMTMLLMY